MNFKTLHLCAFVAVITLMTACQSTNGDGTSANASAITANNTAEDPASKVFKPEDHSPELNPLKDISDGQFNKGANNPFEIEGEQIHHDFSPVYFAFNSTAIDKSNLRPLKILAKYIADNKNFHLIIHGHTDEKGSEQYNRILSEKRALAVREVLLSYYDITTKIHTIGMGEEQLATPGDSIKDHANNRRAQFEIIAVSK
ncbi:OmpA family protein [Lentisphaera profundi]|uniref:OmpA family protein n=1 Tax=Lentisphaera profundi TaxID=1658616 RepID=A0ABY7VVT1_9BACT|nr:OmpA family protein [Lentisphaera profundi]WDE97822.1 OmpA family protein [Lentisphaera profundi]